MRAGRAVIVAGVIASIAIGGASRAAEHAEHTERAPISEQAFAACAPWYLEEGDDCVIAVDAAPDGAKHPGGPREVRGTCAELPDNRLYCKPTPRR